MMNYLSYFENEFFLPYYIESITLKSFELLWEIILIRVVVTTTHRCGLGMILEHDSL